MLLQLLTYFYILTTTSSLASPPPTAINLVQHSKLIGSGASSGWVKQGFSVAISSDSSTLASCGPVNNNYEGACWIFIHVDSTWQQQGSKLVGVDIANQANFGNTAALNSDGNTLAVGGSGDNSDTGASFIFVRSSSIWSQQGSKLIGVGDVNCPSPNGQGRSVALSSDGNILASSGNGCVFIFVRSTVDSTWAQSGLSIVGTGGASFGMAVALNSDGTTLAVRGLVGGSDEIMKYQAAAWIFSRDENIWSEQASLLTGNDGLPSGYTYSTPNAIALNGDGNTLALGAHNDNTYEGCVWIFIRSWSSAPPKWIQQGPKLVGVGTLTGPHARQGNAVTLSNDGNVLISGAPGDDLGTDYTLRVGSLWTFTRFGSTWSQLPGSDAVVGSNVIGPASFGYSLSMSSDSSIVVVGAPFDDSNVGSAFVFVNNRDDYSQHLLIMAKLHEQAAQIKELKCMIGSLVSHAPTLVPTFKPTTKSPSRKPTGKPTKKPSVNFG
jgi:hypothetical protein